MRYLVSVAVLSLLLHGCAGDNREQLEQKAREYFSLAPTYFENTVSIKDDELDTIATFSTEPSFRVTQGLLGQVPEDNFIRGFLDKRTRAKTFQVYTYLTYRDREWRFYRTANYEAPGGPRSVRVTKIFSDVDCSNSRYTGCRYQEHVGFVVEESVLRQVASFADQAQGKIMGWRYKLKPKLGEDLQTGLSAAEVKGLLDAMDKYDP